MSLLRSIIGFDTGFVTTNHHQAIQTLGNGLKKNAQSADSIIEGIEWNDAREKSFMVGVQWHPERMDTSNAFSGKLLHRFLAEVKKYAATLQKVK
jgi:putative glutamine amidotransferase